MTAILRLTEQVDWVGSRLVGPSVFVVVGVGIWLVALGDWVLADLWIWLSLFLVAASTFLGIYSGLEGKEISRLADELGREHREVRNALTQLLPLAGLDTLILLIIVWLRSSSLRCDGLRTGSRTGSAMAVPLALADKDGTQPPVDPLR